MRIRLTQIALRIGDELHQIGAELVAGVHAAEPILQARLDAGTAELLDAIESGEHSAEAGASVGDIVDGYLRSLDEVGQKLEQTVSAIESAGSDDRGGAIDRLVDGLMAYGHRMTTLGPRVEALLGRSSNEITPPATTDTGGGDSAAPGTGGEDSQGGYGVSAPEGGTSVPAASADGTATASGEATADESAASNDQGAGSEPGAASDTRGGQVRLARPPAPEGDGTTVGAQPAAHTPSGADAEAAGASAPAADAPAPPPAPRRQARKAH